MLMDNYEYGVTWLNPLTGKHFLVYDEEWGTYGWANHEALEVLGMPDRTGVKIMRRLKAGEPEDFLLYVDGKEEE